MDYLTIDVETFSAAPLAETGLYRYTEDPSWELLLTGYAFNDDPVQVVDHTANEALPDKLREALTDPSVLKIAHNCAFERAAFQRYLGEYMPPEQWLDTMVLCAVCGLPMSLDQAGKALGFGEDYQKDAAGKALIRLFSIPRKPTKTNPATRVHPQDYPEKWQQYIEYNRQDVVSERKIYQLLKQWEPDEREHRLWCMDARMNEHGVRIDGTLARQAVILGSTEREKLTLRAIELTGLENPNSVAQVKSWLKEQEGVEVLSLNKKVIGDVYSSLQGDKAKEFLDIRAALSKSSIKKYESMLRCICADDHAKGCFQFYGAGRTGRFSGRLIQFQNLPQNHMEDLDVARQLVRAGDYETVAALYDNVASTLSELIRTALIAEPGHTLLIADYSAIEARVLSWIAAEEWRLDTFRSGGDIYCASASQMFKVPVVKHGINGELRQKGKVAELALGYGGGVGALKAFGADKLGMSEEEMGETVARWREASPKVVNLWKDLEQAACKCAARKTATKASCGIRFDYEKCIMWMTLPSGRRIAYWQAEYSESSRRYGKTLNYMGRNQTTGKWERIETWGGKLTENLVQATARDCLREALLDLEDEGWTPIATVHDEIICTEPMGGRTWKDLAAVMSRVHPWEEGLPLNADGYETPYYKKD